MGFLLLIITMNTILKGTTEITLGLDRVISSTIIQYTMKTVTTTTIVSKMHIGWKKYKWKTIKGMDKHW